MGLSGIVFLCIFASILESTFVHCVSRGSISRVDFPHHASSFNRASRTTPPEPPLLPAEFTLPFHEWIIGDMTSTGTWLYDSSPSREIERHDDLTKLRWCNSIHILPRKDGGPCSILERERGRYILFHSSKTCCFCCEASQCGGMTKRDFLREGEAVFLGEERLLQTGQEVNVWNAKCGIDEYWWLTDRVSGLPVRYTHMIEGVLMHNMTYVDGEVVLKEPDPHLFEFSFCKVNDDLPLCDGMCREGNLKNPLQRV